jgi:hypothetical protein
MFYRFCFVIVFFHIGIDIFYFTDFWKHFCEEEKIIRFMSPFCLTVRGIQLIITGWPFFLILMHFTVLVSFSYPEPHPDWIRI